MKISNLNLGIRSMVQKGKVAAIRYWARNTATLPPDCGLREYSAYNIRIGIYRNYPVNERICETERRAIHYAALHGDYQAVRMLIWLGADLNYRDIPGLTPLEYAVRYQQYRCVRIIARALERRQRAQLDQEPSQT